MKILVISQYFPPDGGGGSKRVSNALLGLQQRGHQIEVVAAFPHYPHGNVPNQYRKKALVFEEWRKQRVVRVWVPPIAHRGLVRRLVMYVTFAVSSLFALPLVKNADIIWAANANVFSSFPAMIYGIIKRIPVVRNVDDLWPEAAIEEGYLRKGLVAKIGRLLAKIAYKFSKAITPISRGYKEAIINSYSVPAKKICVIEVGVDSEVFRPISSSEELEKRRDKSITVMYSGIFGTGYNFDLLLKIAKLVSNNKRVKFIIHGFGERENEIRRKIKEMGLDNTKLSTDFFPLASFVEFLNSADIFILPMMPAKAHEAGLPTKIFEYMACAKPIICCSEGEAANLIRLSQAGIVVSPHDPQEAVKAISHLIKDEKMRKKLGENGRKYVKEHLSILQIAKKLERIFHTIITSSSSVARY